MDDTNSIHVNVREWASMRVQDRHDMQVKAELAALASEERMLKLFADHQNHSREIHKGQEERLATLAAGVDVLQSIIDQQRGARNLIAIFGVGTIVNLVISVVAVLTR